MAYTPKTGFIPSEELKPAEYDKFLAMDDMGVYALSWYMDTVAPKWGIVSNSNQKVFLPIAYKSRTGYKNVYQPFFTMFTIPVNINGDDLFFYLQTLQENFDYTEIHLPFVYNGKLPSGMTAAKRVRQEMRIDSYPLIRENYSDSVVRSLKKAEKAELRLEYNIKPEDVTTQFFNNKGPGLDDIKTDDIKRLNRLIAAAIKNNAGFTVGCYSGKELLATAFFLTHGKRLIYLKGSVNETGKNSGAMYFIFDAVIKEKGNDFAMLDFAGSNVTNVSEFYHRLGGKDVPYTRITSTAKGMAKFIQRIKPFVKRNRK
jgi:hypothetical protein